MFSLINLTGVAMDIAMGISAVFHGNCSDLSGFETVNWPF